MALRSGEHAWNSFRSQQTSQPGAATLAVLQPLAKDHKALLKMMAPQRKTLANIQGDVWPTLKDKIIGGQGSNQERTRPVKRQLALEGRGSL